MGVDSKMINLQCPQGLGASAGKDDPFRDLEQGSFSSDAQPLPPSCSCRYLCTGWLPLAAGAPYSKR